jgi:hypothetical protein
MTANVDLSAIRAKVRRVTGRPSQNQLSDTDLDDYINTFYLYDLPEHLRLLNLKQTFSFITEQNVDIYNFTPNTNISVEPPVYVGGYEVFFSQSREEYFSLYPEIQRNDVLSAGDGTAGPYTGTITATPVKRNRVIVSAVDTGGNALSATDEAAAGVLAGDVAAGATVNYTTGAIAGLTWTGNIAATENIQVQYVNYQAARPQAVLFFEDTFQLTPVPDQAYRVEMNTYVTPTALAASTSEPQLREWWQLIAMGAALKIFGDNLDIESYQKALPFFDEQKRLVERRTIKQLTPNRVATIYTDPVPIRQPFNSGT